MGLRGRCLIEREKHLLDFLHGELMSIFQKLSTLCFGVVILIFSSFVNVPFSLVMIIFGFFIRMQYHEKDNDWIQFSFLWILCTLYLDFGTAPFLNCSGFWVYEINIQDSSYPMSWLVSVHKFFGAILFFSFKTVWSIILQFFLIMDIIK